MRPDEHTPGDPIRLDLEEWVAWINKFLVGHIPDQSIPAGYQEPYMALRAVYEQLDNKGQRDLFAEAVKILFEVTPIIDQNAKYFRSLIELLAFLKPYSSKNLVRRHLFARSFIRMEDGMMNLHTLLLIANGKYEVDQELSEFIKRTAAESQDVGYLISCLRAISQAGGRDYLKLLDIILPRFKNERTAVLMAREMGDITFLHGARHFSTWYSSTARSVVRGNQLFDSFELLEGALKRLVFPASELYGTETNPHRMLVAAQLHSYDYRFDAKQVLAIARLHAETGRDTTVDALVNIWNRIKRLMQDEGLPWYYIPSPPGARPGLPQFQALISSGPNPNTSVSAKFWESQEPVLAEIFEAVKDECYGVPERLWRMAGT